MNKRTLTSIALIFASSFSFAYTLTGEGHVSDPVIIKNDPNFKVIENTGNITAEPEKKSQAMVAQKQQFSMKLF
jgi:hypothetical protein